MRMKLRTRLEDDRGVSMVLVAICLLVILGMAALSIDAGGLYSRHRHMVSAADAAALAYAQSCVLPGGGNADTEADLLATTNVPSATRVPSKWNVTGTCNSASASSAGSVTVAYQSTQNLHFAPVLGFARTKVITATAKATWGGAGSAIVPPVMMNQADFSKCKFSGFPGPPPPGPEQQCQLTFPKLGNGDWGGLNLNNPPQPPATCQSSSPLGWNVCTANRSNCGGASAALAKGWMTTGSGPLILNSSGATWVCADNGQAESVWMIFNQKIGQVLCFPVADPTKQFPLAPASPVAYDVVGFVPLRIVNFSKHGSDLFLTVSWAGPHSCGADSGGPGTFGGTGFQLSG